MRQRDTFFDTCKYLLIILVIAGHFMDSYKHLYGWMEYIYSFVYLFHMPFFAFISGYFSKRLTRKKLLKGSLMLLESFVILQIGFLWLRNEEFPEWRSVFSPWYAPWYLMSLIWWRFAAYICLNAGHPKLCVSIAIAIGLFSGFLTGSIEPTSFLSLIRTCAFLPFFIIGLYASPELIVLLRKYHHAPFIILLLVVALSLTAFNGQELNFVEYGNGFHWDTLPPVESFLLFGKRIYFFASAFILIICFLNLLPSLKQCAGFGSRTMFFFSYHIFFVLLFTYHLRPWLHIVHPGWWYPLLSLVLTVLSLNILSRYSIFTNFLNPISSLLKLLNKDNRRKRKEQGL